MVPEEWHKQNKLYNSLIRNVFHHDDWQERAEAARKLGYLKDKRATNLLCKALRKEEDHLVVNRIIEALGRIGDPRATMRIIEKLKEELDKFKGDKFRIKYIIESLTRLKDKRALPYIGPFLRSSDEDLKKLAKEAFDIIEPEWEKILEKEKTKDKTIESIFKEKYP
ncbi:MAG: HEAT repeat domain-containing protein [Promethearchaeia archaeon]